MIGPIIEELAEDFDGKAKICKVNTDEEQELAIKYNIRSIPSIFLLKDGEIINNMVGAQSKEKFEEELGKILES
jgi:thioredoxin 1